MPLPTPEQLRELEQRDAERQRALEAWEPQVGPLFGYRMWQINGPEEARLDEVSPLTLHSMGVTETRWPGKNEWLIAVCPKHGRDPSWVSPPVHYTTVGVLAHGAAPGVGCTCGIYGDDSKPKAFSRARGAHGPTAVGCVEFAGRIVVHEKGFRAERARIVRCRVMPSKIPGLQTALIEEGLALSGYPVTPWARCECNGSMDAADPSTDTYSCADCGKTVTGTEMNSEWWV